MTERASGRVSLSRNFRVFATQLEDTVGKVTVRRLERLGELAVAEAEAEARKRLDAPRPSERRRFPGRIHYVNGFRAKVQRTTTGARVELYNVAPSAPFLKASARRDHMIGPRNAPYIAWPLNPRWPRPRNRGHVTSRPVRWTADGPNSRGGADAYESIPLVAMRRAAQRQRGDTGRRASRTGRARVV